MKNNAEAGAIECEVGDRVRIRPDSETPPAWKYGGQSGEVTMTAPGPYGPTFFVQVDGNDFDTAFEERDLLDPSEWEEDMG